MACQLACHPLDENLVVNNLDPVITSATGPIEPQPKGTSITATATYTDVGTQDTHTCTFSWDDDTSATPVDGSAGSCSATHTYTADGVYNVIVTVTDDDTGFASQNL